MSTPPSPDAARTDAHAAFARSDWSTVFDGLQPLGDAGDLTPDDELILAEAATLLARVPEARRAYERAVTGFERSGRPGDAAIACTSLWRISKDRSEAAIARGWLTRAERGAEAAGEHRAAAHVAQARAFIASTSGDTVRALELLREAETIARRHGDVSMEALAICRVGRMLIASGDLAAGQARIDEAMALATSGDIGPVLSFVVYCTTIDACCDVADYGRAAEWTQVANEWCERRRIGGGLVGICRVHRAELLRIRGAWELAAREIAEAREDLTRAQMDRGVAWVLYEKGCLLLRAGDLAGAEEAFRDAHAMGFDPQPGLSQLWLLQGKADAAASALARALDDREGAQAARARILPTFIEALLRCGGLDRAESAVAELEDIAKRFPTSGFRAEALAARGALLMARGEASAVRTLRQAILLWHEVGAPYEVARLRRLLAEAYEREGDLDASHLEREAARDAFTRLGARVECDRTPSPRPSSSSDTIAGGLRPPPELLDGKLELQCKLGEGGMGAVYRARHRLTGRDVAVKILRSGACDEPRQCERLLQEALAAGRIRHPNVIDVYDAGIHAGAPYLVLELLEGESVAERLGRTGPFAVDDALDVISQALAGVAAAHAQRIVHRDLKPDNLFLCAGDRLVVKVLAFGVAKLQDGGVAAVTGTGALVGTPYYMAPEQVEGRRDLDARVDVWALGIVLFELLTGRRPFTAEHYGALLLEIVTGEVPSVRADRPDIPEAVEQLVRRATVRDRDHRFADAAAFAAAIAEHRIGART